jgi:PAS domain S-box-containing protein
MSKGTGADGPSPGAAPAARPAGAEDAGYGHHWEQDPDYRFIAFHGGPHSRPTLPEAQVLGRRRWELDHAEPLHGSWQEHIAVLDQRLPLREFEYRVGQGEATIFISVSGDPRYDASGRFLGYAGTTLNITRRMQALEQARASSERLATTLENLTDAFFTLDRQWRVTYANREAERLSGRRREDVLGKVMWEAFPDSRGTPFHGAYEAAQNDRRATRVEAYSKTLGAWVQASVHPTADGIAIYFRDVTESRRAQDALAASEERFRTLFETSMDAIFLSEPDGSISACNPAACRMFGLTQAQLRGRLCNDLVAPEDRRLDALLDERARQGTASGQLTMLRDDGSRFEAEIAASVHTGTDGRIHASVLMRDISERIAHQRQVLEANANLSARVGERTAELEAANAQLRAFAHSLAHDLRAPVAAIDGFARRLEEQGDPAAATPERHYLGRIRAAAQRLDEYIEALLSLAHVVQAPLRVVEVDLSQVAGAVLAELKERDPARRVVAQVRPGLRARGDATLLRIVLENLLENAWKFTSPRATGEILVDQVAGEDGDPVFRVRDNGVGFDMAYADKLFTSFQRLHTHAEFPGTGIGLANVSRIVTRHGGRIWAQSAEGAGATFFFTIRTSGA